MALQYCGYKIILTYRLAHAVPAAVMPTRLYVNYSKIASDAFVCIE